MDNFYSMSYVWYTLFGAINTTVVGLVSSMTIFSKTTKQEKPTNDGTGAADVVAIFWPVNFNANQLNILVLLPLL